MKFWVWEGGAGEHLEHVFFAKKLRRNGGVGIGAGGGEGRGSCLPNGLQPVSMFIMILEKLGILRCTYCKNFQPLIETTGKQKKFQWQ